MPPSFSLSLSLSDSSLFVLRSHAPFTPDCATAFYGQDEINFVSLNFHLSKRAHQHRLLAGGGPSARLCRLCQVIVLPSAPAGWRSGVLNAHRKLTENMCGTAAQGKEGRLVERRKEATVASEQRNADKSKANGEGPGERECGTLCSCACVFGVCFGRSVGQPLPKGHRQTGHQI